jgi:hypothetical protein
VSAATPCGWAPSCDSRSRLLSTDGGKLTGGSSLPLGPRLDGTQHGYHVGSSEAEV